ncbi:hypothetical protein ACQHIH_16060 [Xanthomonas sontii]|uniref:hypothetical protein n=1 Tax=Xanthomonas sontii TaxID=2650745 RepID=UPI003F862C9D
MPSNKELEIRLCGWASEYAGGRYENVGWPGRSWLHTLVKYHGKAPDGVIGEVVTLGTPADEVEKAVERLERTKDGFKPGRVLRAEYWMPNAPEEQKLQSLRAMGLPMSRQGYYGYLKCAKFYVAAAIGVDVGEIIEEDCCV